MEETAKYRILFRGEIVEGANIDDVKVRVAALFKSDVQKIEHLFSGKTKILKKDADLKSCRKIKAAFKRAGAVCQIQQQTEDLGLNIENIETVPDKKPETGQSMAAAKGMLASTKKALGNVKDKINIEELKNRATETKQKLDSAPIKESLAKTASQLNEKKDTVRSMGKDALSAVQDDYRAGGIKNTLKNRYVLIASGLCVALLCGLFFTINSGDKTEIGKGEAGKDSDTPYLEKGLDDDVIEEAASTAKKIVNAVMAESNDPIKMAEFSAHIQGTLEELDKGGIGFEKTVLGVQYGLGYAEVLYLFYKDKYRCTEVRAFSDHLDHTRFIRMHLLKVVSRWEGIRDRQPTEEKKNQVATLVNMIKLQTAYIKKLYLSHTLRPDC